ncbi:MAG TPA: plastocyanin/azurin family copper-binding protein [Hanamia sp.]|nr:plastocyanin/azurin family copper-binding protein [Hanamia sp.]
MVKLTAVLGIRVCLLFPILFLFSCSSPNKKSTANQTETKENVHKLDTVTINLMKFNPEVLDVNKGDTVVWINKGLVAHTVKSYQDNKFYSDTLQPGQMWKWIVKDSAAYFCTIHPYTMKGKLVLK